MKLVLLPGFDGTGMLFAPFLQVLPSWITATVVSYPTDRACSANDLFDIVLRGLPKCEPYALVGESFSGPLALRATVSHSHPPAALILCASFGKCPLPKIIHRVLALFVSVLAPLRPPTWFVRRYLLGDASTEIVTLFYKMISTVSPRALRRRFEALSEFDDQYTPQSLPIPLLYLQATRDRLISARHARFLTWRYPSMRIAQIESAHLILQVRPEESARAILDFLSGLERC